LDSNDSVNFPGGIHDAKAIMIAHVVMYFFILIFYIPKRDLVRLK
jgi:hypothetical protein